jgi:hypothetical protein
MWLMDKTSNNNTVYATRFLRSLTQLHVSTLHGHHQASIWIFEKKRYNKLEMLEIRSNFYRIVSHIVYIICKYKNTKKKIPNCSANIFFKQQCFKKVSFRIMQTLRFLTPLQSLKYTKTKAQKIRKTLNLPRSLKWTHKGWGFLRCLSVCIILNASNRFRLNFVLGIQILTWILFCPVL